MHSRMKYNCIDCGGKGICEHGKQTSHCSQGCGGSSWCAHGRIKRQCNLCGGSSVCEHGKRKSQCRPCGGSSFCAAHGRRKTICKECQGVKGLPRAADKVSKNLVSVRVGRASLCGHKRRKKECSECTIGPFLCKHGKDWTRCKEP